MGGQFLWPADERWPTCTAQEEPPMDMSWESLSVPGPDGQSQVSGELQVSGVPVGHALHNDYLVGIMQLRREDVPELGFHQGTDLFQLLWCPRDHPEEYAPYCRVFWRRAADVRHPLARTPEASRPDGALLPPTCTLSPERVEEYPPRWLLPDDLDDRIRQWEASGAAQGVSYHFQLSTAPGTKVGGYAHPTYGRYERRCPVCGVAMEHLLTIDSGETRMPEAGGRWDAEPLPEDLFFLIGRGGNLTVFICRRHEGEWPIAWTL
jgi:hypothetical protein